MRRICVISLSVVILSLSFTASSPAQWAATYWGSYLNDIHKTPDNGFIASRGEEGGLRIEKFDPVGVPVWSKTYYHNNGGMLYSRTLYTHVIRRSRLEPTSDDGYALATLIYQQPNGTYGAGRHDIWFLKLDAEGEIEWQRTYGGADYDSPSDMHQTTDGGYILAGRTKSFGQQGIWVVKLDSSGNVEWEKVYGGYIAMSIQQTSDDGYIVTGWTSSAGAGGNDIWVLKLDANGDIEPDLQKTFGGANDDTGYIIKQTADGGYILGGETQSFNIQPGTKACLWILKLDVSLNVEWQKTYSGTTLLEEPMYWPDREIAHDIIQTADGNFVVVGSTNHFGHGWQEAWILKLDATNQGAVLWEQTYGGEEDPYNIPEWTEAFFSVIEAADGSITAAGSTQMSLFIGELGFMVTMDANGQIPGCSLMGDSSAIVTASSVAGQTTQAVPQTTNALTSLPPGAATIINPRLKEFVCPAGVDLSIKITDTPDPIRPGHHVAYVLTAENLGTDQTTNVSVDVVLPAGLTYFSATSTQGTASESGGTVTFDVESLPAGDSATLSIIAQVGVAGDYNVTAEITGDDIAFDSVAENNTDSETTRVSSWLNVTVDSAGWGGFDMAVDSKGFAHFVYTSGYDLRYATNTSGEWLRWTLVDNGNVENTAIAIDSADRVHIAFGEGGALKYINNVSGAWSTPQVLTDAAGAAWSISMAVGSDNSVHLCYLMRGMAPSNLIYMTTQNQDPGEWTAQTLHLTGYNATALALDSANYAHVIFYSFQVINRSGVGYITNTPNGAWQAIEEVDENWSGGQMEGMDLDIAVDKNNLPHIVFSGDTDGALNGGAEDTRYAARGGSGWTLDTVDDGENGSAGKSISVDQDGFAHVSYHHMLTGDFRVGNNRSGSWDITTVSSDGWFNAIAADRLGQAHVGYTDGGILKYAIVQSLPDSDGDGVSDVEEDTAPNSGDGNSDGTQDSLQSHVVSLETFDGTQVVTLLAPDTTVLTQVRSLYSPNPDGMPENATFPFGFFEFILLGAEIGTRVGVDLMLPDDSTNSYFKYGPTPLDPTEHWYLFDWDEEIGAQVSGSTITLNLEDGQRGDQDLVANGIIQDPGGPAVGPAGLQHIRLSPPILEFGQVMVGEYAELDLTVMNVGSANLSIDGVSIPDLPFGVIDDDCSAETLVPGGSCVVSLSFAPLLLGDARQVILVLSDDPSFPSLGVTLLGEGLPTPEPEIQVLPASLTFGDVNVGSNAELSISISNVGAQTLHVGSVGALTVPYSIVEDNLSGAVIHTGDSALLTVRFAPLSSGVASTALQIPSDDPDNSPLTVPISGTGIGIDPESPVLSISTASIYFGESTTEDSFSISNTGTGALSWTISQALPDWLSVSPMSGDTTSTPAEVTVSVDRSLAQGSGNHNTSILIFSNGGNGSVLIEMTKPTVNTVPLADAGEDQMVVVDYPLTLDGTSSSDPDGDPIVNYEWQFVWDQENGTAPIALGASLTDYQTAHPVFTCTRPGQFTLSLVVIDSRRGESEPDLIHLTVQDASLSHSDTDGIPDADELGPDGTTIDFDGNNDQIPDHDQNNVASVLTESGDDYITIASEGDTFLSGVQMLNGSSGGALPDGFTFQQQFFAFTINDVEPGGTTTVTIYLPVGTSADTYYKHGPTPDNAIPHWYEFMWDGTTGAQITGNVITLTFVDGQRGDDVLVPDGQIIDLGGPGITADDDSGGGSTNCFVGLL